MKNLLHTTSIFARGAVLAQLLCGVTAPPALAITVPGPFTNTNGSALDNYNQCLRNSNAGVCDIVGMPDSIESCTQIAPCTYGPYNNANSPSIAFRNALLARYTMYSTGLRPPFRLVPVATVDGGEGGYTLTSGTVSSSTAFFGPGQTGYSLNGQQNLTASSGAVLTINVGQGYRQLNVYCGTGPSSTGWAVTIGGTSVGTACGTTSGSIQGNIATFSNAAITTATATSFNITGTVLTVTTVGSGTFAAGGVLTGTSVTAGTTILYQMTGTSGGAGTYALSASSTASSGTVTQTGGLVNLAVTLTASGASSFLNGYEAVVTTGTTGVAFHHLGEGAASAAFWTQNANALSLIGLIAGQSGHQLGMCVGQGGQNDAQNPSVVTPAQVVAQWNSVAIYCAARGASFSFHIPTPYNSSTANQYAFIQLALWQWAMKPTTGPVWDLLILSQAYAGVGVTGVSGAGGAPNFIVQDQAAAIAQDVSMNLLQPADSQHPTDLGSCIITNYIVSHYIPDFQAMNCYWQPQNAYGNNRITLTANYTNATTSFTAIADTSHTMQWTIYGGQFVHIQCHLYTSIAATGALSLTVAGTGTPASLAQSFEAFTGASAKTEIVAQTAAFSTAATLGVSQTATTVFTADYYADLQYTASPNVSTVISIQAHPSTSTMTIYANSWCNFVSP